MKSNDDEIKLFSILFFVLGVWMKKALKLEAEKCHEKH